MFFNTKKAQEGLSLNTVIVAIIVLVVLIVIIAFFAGGTGSVIDKIRGIFTGKTAGEDMAIAVQNCQEYCDQAKSLVTTFGDSSEQVLNSAYCTTWFKMDLDPKDSTADKWGKSQTGKEGEYKHYYCSATIHNKQDINAHTTKGIGIECPITC